MGLTSLFQKKANYFDKKITPQCSYCQYGKRTKTGSRILCEHKGLMDETASCSKFVYSPLKRIPVKQLNIEGAVADEEMYAEVKEDEETAPAEKKTEAAPKEEAPAEDAPATEE